MCTCALSMQEFPSSQGSLKKSTSLKCDQEQCINLLTSQMQWSLSILISSVRVCLSVGQQEFHNLKVALPEVT